MEHGLGEGVDDALKPLQEGGAEERHLEVPAVPTEPVSKRRRELSMGSLLRPATCVVTRVEGETGGM